ncbi:MAG: chemotaxis protein CheA [Campylobacterota bacterium]|nr:chemotaxis protein CheA [Campylobacterota bacterium]
MNPLLEQFLQEARENLSFIDQNLENIGSDDPELLNSVFRAAHTLKGGSGIVGFESVKDITHNAEDLLDMLRAKKIEFKETMIESLYNAFDEVMNLIEAAEDTEDIVDADPDTIESIIADLKEQMGKDGEKEVWEMPFEMCSDPQPLINLPMPFLREALLTVPFKNPEFNEEECSKKQLYSVLFDIDESSMVFGNDPVYTMSLMNDDILGLHVCMSEDNAKSALSGMDDPDGLLLKVKMCALIYATYEEIEETLFNFADELVLYPLDISSLLQISEGEAGLQLDVLKELPSTLGKLIDDMDKVEIEEEINKSMPLIGQDTLQYHQLNRLLCIINMIDYDDMKYLHEFISNLDKGIVFTSETTASASNDTNSEEPTQPQVTSEVEKKEPTVIRDDISKSTQDTIKEILSQQLESLENFSDEDSVDRVIAIVNKLEPFTKTQADSYDFDGLVAWLSAELGTSAKIVSKPEEDSKKELKDSSSEPALKVTKKDKPEKVEKQKAVIGKTVKIEQESIDHLMNVVGELLVAKNSLPYLAENVADMSGELISRAIMEKYTFINRLSEQLQELIMGMRMLPISYVFDRYPKLVRDISKNLGKKVNLTMEGGETKLDKNMIEMLADPMIHIMRNSLDHGIELPEDRVQKGKSAEGNITLRAYSQSDKIVIEIIDDGAGININRVIQKVLENELMTIEQIDALSDNEKAELVMLAGLSTADEISEYSGRGVGMDVVKRSIENFSGKISITTRANFGTTITLSIPVSLAVSSLLHVMMNDIHYGLPMDSVSETVKIDSKDIEYLHNEPFIYLRGEVIPLLFIKSMLNEEQLNQESLSIVVLNIKDNLLAVVVNELLGQLDVVQKPLEGVMEHHPILSGTALLGNGQIIMAIDPMGILSIANDLKQDLEAC